MNNPLRRNRVGTKARDLWNWQVEDIRKMTGPLAVQQYLQQLIRQDPANIKRIIECPQQVDLNQWKYEHTRQIVLELNLLVTSLKDICTKETCPRMKGSQQSQFLCTAHKTAQNCTALQYMSHNLDQATSILLNNKTFATRTNIGDTKSLDTVFRRLYRIFSHTYFYHKEIFESFEKDMFLCERFVSFGLKYAMLDQSISGKFQSKVIVVSQNCWESKFSERQAQQRMAYMDQKIVICILSD